MTVSSSYILGGCSDCILAMYWGHSDCILAVKCIF